MKVVGNANRLRSGLPCLFLRPMSSPDEDIAFLTNLFVFVEKSGIQNVPLYFCDIPLDVLRFGFWSWSWVIVSFGHSLSRSFCCILL